MSVAKIFDFGSLDVLQECSRRSLQDSPCDTKVPRAKQMPGRLTELYNKVPLGRVNILDLGQLTFQHSSIGLSLCHMWKRETTFSALVKEAANPQRHPTPPSKVQVNN